MVAKAYYFTRTIPHHTIITYHFNADEISLPKYPDEDGILLEGADAKSDGIVFGVSHFDQLELNETSL